MTDKQYLWTHDQLRQVDESRALLRKQIRTLEMMNGPQAHLMCKFLISVEQTLIRLDLSDFQAIADYNFPEES